MVFSIILSSLFLTTLSSLYFQNIFLKKKVFDKINIRSSHSSIATRSAGSSLFIVLFIISFYFYFNGILLFDYSILIPLSILFLIGLYDDIYNIGFKLKFIFQIIVAKIIIDNGFIIDNLHGVFGIFEINRIIAQVITMFIIISIINAINFIDGIDGLAISVIVLFIISFEFFALSNTDFHYLSIMILACLTPLYYFNFRKKNKVFLGDSGSYLLGGITSLYVLNILSHDYIIKPEFDIHKIMFVFTILIYPIIDIIRIFIIRIYRGKSPFIADKNHIHHHLNNFLKSHLKTTLTIIFLSFIIITLTQLLVNQKMPYMGIN